MYGSVIVDVDCTDDGVLSSPSGGSETDDGVLSSPSGGSETDDGGSGDSTCSLFFKKDKIFFI